MKTLLLATLFVAGSAIAHADLRGEITSMGKVISKDMRTKNYKGLDHAMRAGMTTNFTYVENGQTQTYDQMFANMKAGIGQMMHFDRVGTSIVSLKQKGNSATCLMSHTMVGTTSGPDKKVHKLVFSGTSEDTYVKVGGKWKMSKMAWKNQKVMMDGKTVHTGQ